MLQSTLRMLGLDLQLHLLLWLQHVIQRWLLCCLILTADWTQWLLWIQIRNEIRICTLPFWESSAWWCGRLSWHEWLQWRIKWVQVLLLLLPGRLLW